jgi:UDP-N-acetylenolpyruvoylglucosamine reductase
MESFGSSFEVTCGGRFLGRVRLEVPGIKNVSNATGVIALAMELGVPWEHIAPALAGFTGVTRRFEVKYKTADFMVVDDYAHHPTEIRATLAAARNAGWKRVVALFQPHRYSRTKFLLEDFASAFGDADAVFLTDVYAASEVPLDGIDGGTLADSVRAGGHALVHYESSLKALQHAVSQALRPGDLVVTLGAGNIHEVAARLSRELAHFEELVGLMRDGSKLLRQEPMSRHTTLRLGGPAELWFEPASVRDLTAALQWASRHHMAWTPIGRGSNLLVRDGGIAGLCVHLSHPSFSEVIVEGSTIRAGAGVRLKAIVQTAKKAGLGGLEFLEGIPGNLGGAIRMNAGAMQGWTMDVIESVTSVDAAGVEHTTRKEDLEIKYRSVPRYERELVLSAVLRGTPVAPGEIDERLKAYSNKRWNSQPAAPSAGCIFKNPGEEPAGRMIDVTGLKNLAVGAARVSEVHGNFIVNDGGATASDVLELIHLIQEKIRAQRGVELETEVIILGENA